MEKQNLSKMLKEHQLRQSKLKLTNVQLRKQAKQAIQESSEQLSEKLNERVLIILKTQKDMDHNEVNTLLQQALLLKKQAKQWSTMINSFNDALKELGDVQHWTTVIERDMDQIMHTLEAVQEERL